MLCVHAGFVAQVVEEGVLLPAEEDLDEKAIVTLMASHTASSALLIYAPICFENGPCTPKESQ